MIPVLRLDLQLAAAHRREPVVLRAPVVFRRPPFGAQQTADFQPMERRIERAFFDLLESRANCCAETPGGRRRAARPRCSRDPSLPNRIIFMKTHIAEFPRHPLPQIPQPPSPQQPRVQPPTVYVYERQQWEYRVVRKNVADEPILSEGDLNALGQDGWELVGVVPLPTMVQFFFKRVKW